MSQKPLNHTRKPYKSTLPVSSLRQEEEERVVQLAKAGDPKAFEKLIKSNRGLVTKIAMRYKNITSMPLEDLVQEGYFGFWPALEKFDADRGYRFTTYLAWYVRSAIQNAISTQARTITIPKHMTELARKLGKMEVGLEPGFLDGKSSEEIGEEVGASSSSVARARTLRAADQVLSYHNPIGPHSDSDFLSGMKDESIISPLAQIERTTLSEHLRALMEMVLTDKERKVICRRFGFYAHRNDADGHTLQQIGDTWGVSRENIRQIEDRARKKLKSHLIALGYALDF